MSTNAQPPLSSPEHPLQQRLSEFHNLSAALLAEIEHLRTILNLPQSPRILH